MFSAGGKDRNFNHHLFITILQYQSSNVLYMYTFPNADIHKIVVIGFFLKKSGIRFLAFIPFPPKIFPPNQGTASRHIH